MAVPVALALVRLVLMADLAVAAVAQTLASAAELGHQGRETMVDLSQYKMAVPVLGGALVP